MKRKDYDNYVWYDLVDEAYWAEDFPEEFPDCFTLIYNPDCCVHPLTQNNSFIGWGTMAKYGGWKFMIIEKPKN